MALSREDHKRISLSIAQELRKVLSDANGSRLLAKHKARIGEAPPEEAPPGEDDDVLSEMAGEEPMLPHDMHDPEEMDETTRAIPQLRAKHKAMPFKKGPMKHG